MVRTFKVEVRTTCKTCGNKLGYRQRTFCSSKCRNKSYNEKAKLSGHSTAWQRKRRDEIASKPDFLKIPCLVCGRWYVQVGTHVVQCHGFKSAREYREYFGLEVKRGTVPQWYREAKGEQVFENGTVNNLKAGENFRFKPNDPRAGRYERSPVTLERLKDLHLLTKNNKKKILGKI